MISNTFSFSSLVNGKMSVSYNELDSKSSANVFHSHTHGECEIYINLSGNVSFIVENRIYPIIPGSVIITRPGEYHHCVYHSDALHRHFWILFSFDGMDNIFSRFFNRGSGENNMLLLSGTSFAQLTSLCHCMSGQSLSEDEELYRFFKLIHLINTADIFQADDQSGSRVMERALDYIHKNMFDAVSVKNIADAAYVSVSTLERAFYKTLSVSPSEYLKKRRLAHASELLKKGASVTEACHQSGFGDCSKFIQLFKTHYGVTPLKWKNT